MSLLMDALRKAEQERKKPDAKAGASLPPDSKSETVMPSIVDSHNINGAPNEDVLFYAEPAEQELEFVEWQRETPETTAPRRHPESAQEDSLTWEPPLTAWQPHESIVHDDAQDSIEITLDTKAWQEPDDLVSEVTTYHEDEAEDSLVAPAEDSPQWQPQQPAPSLAESQTTPHDATGEASAAPLETAQTVTDGAHLEWDDNPTTPNDLIWEDSIPSADRDAALNFQAAAASGQRRSTSLSWLLIAVSVGGLLVVGGGGYYLFEQLGLEKTTYVAGRAESFTPRPAGSLKQLAQPTPSQASAEISSPPDSELAPASAEVQMAERYPPLPEQPEVMPALDIPPHKPPPAAATSNTHRIEVALQNPKPKSRLEVPSPRPPSQRREKQARLQHGYDAYQAGNPDAAAEAFNQVLRQAPQNRTALLGLAACRITQGRISEAQNLYLQVLRLSPKDPVAESALLELTQSVGVEGKSLLKLRIREHPENAYLHFSLGNLYSREKNWAQAQMAYFDAYHYDNLNPNYAYNLAVSLEHLGKPRAALPYYEQAYGLATQQPGNFDRDLLKQRIEMLINKN